MEASLIIPSCCLGWLWEIFCGEGKTGSG